MLQPTCDLVPITNTAVRKLAGAPIECYDGHHDVLTASTPSHTRLEPILDRAAAAAALKDSSGDLHVWYSASNNLNNCSLSSPSYTPSPYTFRIRQHQYTHLLNVALQPQRTHQLLHP